jgi:peptidoglycan/xylan/chitin deacetylase (PgdA/CDA1 family)
MGVGAHTLTHPILARLDDAAAWAEINGGKQALESLLDAPVPAFAYPNGKPLADFLPVHVQMARDAGFEMACTTAWGTSTAAVNPLQLPRFTPWDRSKWRFGARLLGNMRTRGA